MSQECASGEPGVSQDEQRRARGEPGVSQDEPPQVQQQGQKADMLDGFQQRLAGCKWGNLIEVKKLYNQIKYRLARVPEYQAHFKDLQKATDDAGLADLLRELFAGKPGKCNHGVPRQSQDSQEVR